MMPMRFSPRTMWPLPHLPVTCAALRVVVMPVDIAIPLPNWQVPYLRYWSGQALTCCATVPKPAAVA